MYVDPFEQVARRLSEDMKKVAKTNQDAWMKPIEQFYAVKNKHKYGNLPYNIARTDTGFLVELAVAGFAMEDIKVTSSLNWLVVSGIRSGDDNGDYIHRGIAFRDFNQEFKTVDNIESVSASLKNGLLTVKIDVSNPNSAKVQTVQINQE